MLSTRLFSLLGVFSLLFSTQLVNAQSEQPINVISDAERGKVGRENHESNSR